MQILTEFKPSKRYKSIKEDFFWENIPEFAVITGLNGSGKTHLLEFIYEESKDNKGKSYIEFIEAKHSPIIKETSSEHLLIELKKQIITEIKNIKNDQNLYGYHSDKINHYYAETVIRKFFEKFKPEQLDSKHIHYLVRELNEEEYIKLQAFVDREPIENASNGFMQFNLVNIISEFNLQKRDLSSSLLWSRKYNCTTDIFKEVDNELNKLFGYSESPDIIINKTLKEYNFQSEIKVDDANGEYKIYFANQSHKNIKFNELSSGEQVIIQLCCVGFSKEHYNSGYQRLILIDEFDAHLNPSLSEMYIKVVKEVLVNKFKNQVIMTTHHPSTLAFVEEDAIFWMKDGKITSDDKMDIIKKMATGLMVNIGVDGFDYKNPLLNFFADPLKKIFIFTEGQTDIEYIKCAIKKIDQNKYQAIQKKCNFIPMGGVVKKYVSMEILTTFIQEMEKVQNSNKNQFIFLVDNDEEGNKFLKNYLQSSGQVRSDSIHLYKRKDYTYIIRYSNRDKINITIENLFSESFYYKHFNGLDKAKKLEKCKSLMDVLEEDDFEFFREFLDNILSIVNQNNTV